MNPGLRRFAGRMARRVGLRRPAGAHRRSNGRLAFVGPMPPAPTGIASYDRAVMDGLRRTGFLQRHRTDVIWPVRTSQDRRIAAYDLGIYQLGNNARFHGQIYRLAIASPGLVVLHDLALDGLVLRLAKEGDPAALAAAREAAALRSRITDPDMAMHEPLRSVWSAAVARASRGIVVHSAFCKRYLESAGVRTPIFTVPHPVVEDEVSMRRAEPRARELRATLEAAGARTVVVAPGDINEAKCLPALVEAIAALPQDVHAVLVGRRIPGTDIAATIAAHGVGDRVTVHHDVPDDDFRAWLIAADLAVDLRFPHRGEVSGSLSMAMVAGLPRSSRRPGRTSTSRRTSWCASLRDRPTPRSSRAGSWSSGTIRSGAHGSAPPRGRTWPRCATRTRRHAATSEAIVATREVVADPTRAILTRWAGSLAAVGVDEALVDEGFGVSYARALESFERTP